MKINWTMVMSVALGMVLFNLASPFVSMISGMVTGMFAGGGSQ